MKDLLIFFVGVYVVGGVRGAVWGGVKACDDRRDG